MEPRTHRISLKIEPEGLELQSTKTPSSKPGYNRWGSTTQFELDVKEALVAFKQEHPAARVPSDRRPELIAFGEGLKIIGEMATYQPEDFNKRVLGQGDSYLIRRGVDMAVLNELRKDPSYPEGRFLKLALIRALVRRVVVQFAYVEG